MDLAQSQQGSSDAQTRMSEYEAVADTDLYREINMRLVDYLDPKVGGYALDVGSGTGSMAELMLERDPSHLVWASDPDEAMLGSLRLRLGRRVGVLRAGAEDVARWFPPGSLDEVVIGNAIHLVSDIDAVLKSLSGLLRTGGRLALNTAFYSGAERAQDRPLYWSFILRARSNARRLGATAPEGRTRRVLAKRPLRPEQYEASLLAVGMKMVRAESWDVPLSADLLQSIVGAPVFAAGALPGIPTEIATVALVEAVRDVLASREASINRTWYYLVAEKLEGE